MYESMNDTLLEELKGLSNWIEASDSAPRVSRICNALRAAASSCGETRLRSTDEMARAQLAKLDEGLSAAARIVLRFSEDVPVA
ncbi:hypothetical protein [Paraburkholderia sp. CI3]|uniref:hypothetical protein n=1 Tax=Paraburkholderia sp. CI3 TaxID=2991060 RepID=UPI003D1FBF46